MCRLVKIDEYDVRVLDFEQSEKFNGFTMMFIFNGFFSVNDFPHQNIAPVFKRKPIFRYQMSNGRYSGCPDLQHHNLFFEKFLFCVRLNSIQNRKVWKNRLKYNVHTPNNKPNWVKYFWNVFGINTQTLKKKKNGIHLRIIIFIVEYYVLEIIKFY